MIVYGSRKRRRRTRFSGGHWRDAVIWLGEIESALADALCPDRDVPHPLLEQLRSLAIRVASGDLEALQALPPLPETMWTSVPEGYAYYAVYPEDYGKAAVRFFEEARPRSAVVVGIRSIGASLSAVVAATLQRQGCAVRSFTVRPRGHPFERHLAIEGFSWDPAGHVVIVDEGPGLSGSSFACVASYFSSRGVPDERIVLFPSWDSDGSAFVSETARRQWVRHRKYVETRPPLPDCDDLSGGRWRDLFSVATPVQPQHERRKFRRDSRLLKFEGLSAYGEAKLARAQILADAGFAPRPVALSDGYLISEWLSGEPMRAVTADLAAWVARYLRFLEVHCPSDRPVPFDEDLEMIRTNVREGLGPEWARTLERLEQYREAACGRSTAEIDGRLLPHEFLRTPAGYVKTDTLDNYDDHFFPGCQDICWDVAGASVELGCSELEMMAPPECLPFYKVAYLSYRLGYCTLAAQSGWDAELFHAQACNYRRLLRDELDRLR